MTHDETKSGTVPPISPGDIAAQHTVSEESASVLDLRQLSFRYMNEGFSIVDTNGMHVDVNPAFCEMTGFSAEELISSSPHQLYWPPEEYEHIQTAFAKTLLGEFAAFDLTFMRKGGERFPVSVHPFAIISGTNRFFAATVKDMTQQLAVKAALLESEERYRGLFESAGDAIILLEDEEVIDCNRRALELFDFASVDELKSHSSVDFYPKTQPSGEISSAFAYKRLNKTYSGEPQFFEWTHVKRDGTTVNTEVSLSAFRIGEKSLVQAIIRDVTQRKNIESELQNSETRFRTLFENAGDAIAIMEDHRIIDCNQQTLDLYGVSREQVTANDTLDFFPLTQPNGKNSREFFLEMVEAARSGEPKNYEWYGRKRDGTAVITEVTLTTFTIDGKTFEQSISRDITERKRLEASLLTLNRTLESRVEQRTEQLELASAELLRRSIQYRALAANLTQAENEERKRIARLLHDNHQQLLVAARFKLEMLETASNDSDVSQTARQVLDILDQAVEITRSLTMELAPPILYGSGLVAAIQWLGRWMKDNHQLEVDVLGSLPFTPISSDVSGVLIRAVRELLFNVIKHSGIRQARINITLADQRLVLSVTDEGAGFNLADSLGSTESFGLLSIQEQLSALDGRMDVASALENGTTVTLSIPLTPMGLDSQVSPVVNHISTATTHSVQALQGAVRILVADDHAAARKALVQILTLVQDFEVLGEAVDGLDAVEKTRTLKPDVILMDVGMPGLNGIDATRAIMGEFPEVKVIGLSMHSSEEMQDQMILAGAVSYLQKLRPVEELFATIRDVMNRGAAAAS